MPNVLATRLDADLLADVITAAGGASALNTVRLDETLRLQLVVDGRFAGDLDLSPDGAEAAAVECAAALIERQACGDCEVWELRLWCDDDGTDLLVAEWVCPS